MAFDFPNSPSEGTLFAPTGGPVYVYTGGVWRMQGSGQVVTAEARNRIVNGAMQISQEWGDTALGPTGGMNSYAADQWLGASTTTGTATQQRVQSVTPNGSKDRIRLTVNTADTSLAAGEYQLLMQIIEGIRIADFRWGTAAAKQAILRFGFKGPAGTYSAAIRNGPTTRSYIANFTIAVGQANIDTEQVLVIPGDVTGTWTTGNTYGLSITIGIAAGSTYQGVAGWQAGSLFSTATNSNGLATAGNVFELFDVGLYLDPNATGVPPPWQMPDEAQELAACQRYFYALPGSGWVSPYFSSLQYRGSSYRHPVPMRVAPTATGTVSAAAGVTSSNIQGSIDLISYSAVLNNAADGCSFSNVKVTARM
jgi:hypothetical protein